MVQHVGLPKVPEKSEFLSFAAIGHGDSSKKETNQVKLEISWSESEEQNFFILVYLNFFAIHRSIEELVPIIPFRALC
jgi:hypothetical protein